MNPPIPDPIRLDEVLESLRALVEKFDPDREVPTGAAMLQLQEHAQGSGIDLRDGPTRRAVMYGVIWGSADNDVTQGQTIPRLMLLDQIARETEGDDDAQA